MSRTLDPDQPERPVGQFAHHHERIVAVTCVCVAVSGPTPIPAWIMAAIFVVSVAAQVVGYVRHDGRLCERCITEWPTDGERQAERKRGTLAFHHLAADRRFWILLVAVYLAAVVVSRALGVPPVQVATFSALELVVAAQWLAVRRHRLLLPWCPWCRDEGGDGGVPSSDPVPENEAVR